MTAHSDRAKLRAEHNDPINFTCGLCFRVVPFVEGYLCDCMKKEEDEEAV